MSQSGSSIAEAMFKSLVDAATDFVGTIDRDGRFIYLNRAGRAMLEIPEEEDITGISVLPYNEGPSESIRREASHILSTGVESALNVFVSRQGKRIPVMQTFIVHQHNDATYYSTIARDITDRLALEVDLRQRAEQDPLTGLFNRRAFNEQLEALDRSCTYQLVMLDLNGFKGVNDRLGHAKGDEVLQMVARSLVEVCGESAIVARLGGDEFVVVALWQPQVVGQIELQLNAALLPFGASVGIGVAVLDHSTKVSDALRTADELLYSRKRGQAAVPSVVPPSTANSAPVQ